MVTKKDTKTHSGEPLLNNDPDYYDPKKSDISDRAVEAAKTELDVAVGDAERKAEAALDSSDIDKNSPEASLYKQSAIQQSRYQNLVQSVRMASNWKKGGGVAGIVALIGGIMFFFSFLTTFQLVGIIEQLDNVFDAQSNRTLNKRVNLHYKYTIGKDGNGGGGYYKSDLDENSGRLRRTLAIIDPNAMRAELAKNGYAIGADSTGHATLNGERLLGDLGDQRNKLSSILKEQYPNEGWMKRQARARAAYNIAGIKRVFFFENTRGAINNWELEMINRLRARITGTDPTSTARVLGQPDADSQTAADAERTRLENPAYDPATNPDRIASSQTVADALTNFKNVNLASVGNTGLRTLSATGIMDLACDIRFFFKGIQYAAAAVRNIGLLRHASTFMTAAHQMKNGEAVTANQVNSLMVILNREPGIGASGAWQLINGNANAKVKYTDQLSLSFEGATGGAGALTAFNSAADGAFAKADEIIPGQFISPEEYCGISRNLFYQVGSLGAGIIFSIAAVIGTPFTGGASGGGLAIKTIATLTLAAAYEGIKAVASPILIDMLIGPEIMFHYSPSQGGDYNMDGLVAGRHQWASATSYQNGLSRLLSKAQVMETQTIIAQEKAELQKKQSIATRYFDLNNPDSLATKTLLNTPSTPKTLAQASVNKVANLPSVFMNSLGLLTPQGKAKAENPVANPYFVNNPFGIKNYGYSEDDLAKLDEIDAIANEDEIIATGKLEAYKEWRTKCFPKDDETTLYYGLAKDLDEENMLKEECTNLDNADVRKFSAYHIDRALLTGIAFQFKASDCMDPDNDDPNCPFLDENVLANGANDISVDPQAIEYTPFNLTKILAKYTTAVDFVAALNDGKSLDFSVSNCDKAWNSETINSIDTPVEWDKSTHFCWPSSINGKEWTPQGISGSSSTSNYPSVAGKNIIITSWYSLKDETGYTQSRRSDENNTAEAEVNRLVSVDLDSQKYTEIELVVPCNDDTDKLCALGIHAGGVGWLGEKVVVAYGYGFYTFDLSNLRDNGSGRLILPSSGKWKGSGLGLDEDKTLISSSMSVDKSANQIISAGHSYTDPLKIYRWNLSGDGTDFANNVRNVSVNHEFSTAVGVQGIASNNGVTFANSSNADGISGGVGGVLYFWNSFQTGNATGRRVPSGVVEGLYIDAPRDKIWSLTEHGVYAGETQNYVFSIPLASTIATIGKPDDPKVPPVTVNPTISTTSSGVSYVDGDYAWPVGISYQYVGANNEVANVQWTCNTKPDGCHHNGEPAFDLFDDRARNDPSKDGLSVGKAVYAITSGRMEQSKIYKDISGCYSFHIIGDDGHDYYYTHIKNPVITSSGQTKTVKAGDKIAEIGERKCTDPVNQTLPHLHIERAKTGLTVTGVNPETYRDPVLEDIIVDLHNKLPK